VLQLREYGKGVHLKIVQLTDVMHPHRVGAFKKMVERLKKMKHEAEEKIRMESLQPPTNETLTQCCSGDASSILPTSQEDHFTPFETHLKIFKLVRSGNAIVSCLPIFVTRSHFSLLVWILQHSASPAG